MLSYGSAFWPLFWGIIIGGAALTIAAVAIYATAARRSMAREQVPQQPAIFVPAPRTEWVPAPSVR